MGSLADLLTVAIGLTVVYLILSIITSYVQEWIATTFSLRASNLANAIQILLKPSADALAAKKQLDVKFKLGQSIWDKGVSGVAASEIKDSLANEPLFTFYAHPIIKTLSQPGKLPSYISSGDFTTTLVDIFLKAGNQSVSQPAQYLDSLEAAISQLTNNDLKLAVLPYIQAAKVAEGDTEAKIAAARKNIEGWFTSTMDRASGWYKRRMQVIAIVLSFVLVIVFNADTFAIVQHLWRDAGVRSAIGALATSYASQNKAPQAEQVLGELNQVNLPLGWSGRVSSLDPAIPINPQDFPATSEQFLSKILGLLVTALAVSQGSSVWFDLLGKLINLRNNGLKPASPPSQPSA